jgi:hypothetical protein
MRYKIILFLVFLLVGYSDLSGQTPEKHRSEVFAELKEFPLVVYQEQSPLRVDRFLIVRDDDGELRTYYTVMNVGTKAIRNYRFARWYSNNAGFVGYGVMPVGGLLKTGESVSSMPGRTVKFPTRDADTPIPPIVVFAFFMIVGVEFDDGSVLSFEEEFDALEAHIELFEGVYSRRDLSDPK